MSMVKRLIIFCIIIIHSTVSAGVDEKNNLLKDIQVKIQSNDELKVLLVFENKLPADKIKINRIDFMLKASFDDSYVLLDQNKILVEHELLQSIDVSSSQNTLDLVFNSSKDSLFTLKQNENILALSIINKEKIDQIISKDKSNDTLKQEDNKKIDSAAKNDEKIGDKGSEITDKTIVSDISDKSKAVALKNVDDKLSELKSKKSDGKIIQKSVKQATSDKALKGENIKAESNNVDAASKTEKSSGVDSANRKDPVTAKVDKSNPPIAKPVETKNPDNKKGNLKTIAKKDVKTKKVNKNQKSKKVQYLGISPSKIKSFDFRLTEDKAAKIIINFKDNDIVNVTDSKDDSGNLLQLKFKNTSLPYTIEKKYDVKDFGTIVDNIEWSRNGNYALLNIRSNTSADYIAYQKDASLVIEVRDRLDSVGAVSVFKKSYTGKKISLNFQNIELRSVLQIIADFTDLNLVASDSIQGNISLRLMNVPWDQALDIILKTKSLDKRKFGNILMIAPSNEIFELERAELESEQMIERLTKLRTEYFTINYAKAEDVAQLITGKNKILSERGTASFDKRTNILIIQDTPTKLKQIRAVLKKLDSPVKQVLIEARIVKASTNFRKDLGIRWGLSGKRSSNNYQIGVGDTAPNATTVLTDGTVVSPKTRAEIQDAAGDTGFNIDLGLPDATSVLGLALAKLPGKTLVHLELSAFESEGLLQTISSPKLITANKVPARIEQGQEIPYQEATSSGATNVAFKKAVLSLIVTPQITPDDKVILDINVTNDTSDINNPLANGVPVIDTQEVETQILVDNNETIVLGGIFKQTLNNSVERVPFLGDLPVVGHLFRKVQSVDDREEFLIFITPKIVHDKA